MLQVQSMCSSPRSLVIVGLLFKILQFNSINDPQRLNLNCSKEPKAHNQDPQLAQSNFSKPNQRTSIFSISNDSWPGFKVGGSNSVHDSTLFKFLEDMSTLTSYTPLNINFKS
jgi:hypothetical protein